MTYTRHLNQLLICCFPGEPYNLGPRFENCWSRRCITVIFPLVPPWNLATRLHWTGQSVNTYKNKYYSFLCCSLGIVTLTFKRFRIYMYGDVQGVKCICPLILMVFSGAAKQIWLYNFSHSNYTFWLVKDLVNIRAKLEFAWVQVKFRLNVT